MKSSAGSWILSDSQMEAGTKIGTKIGAAGIYALRRLQIGRCGGLRKGPSSRPTVACAITRNAQVTPFYPTTYFKHWVCPVPISKGRPDTLFRGFRARSPFRNGDRLQSRVRHEEVRRGKNQKRAGRSGAKWWGGGTEEWRNGECWKPGRGKPTGGSGRRPRSRA